MTEKYDMQPMQEIQHLFARAKTAHIKSKDLAKESGFAAGTLSSWKKGKTTPIMSNYRMLEDALGRLIK